MDGVKTHVCRDYSQLVSWAEEKIGCPDDPFEFVQTL